VDAKVAWIQNDQTGCEFICFMGAGRIPEARDGVDYYGLVVLSDSSEVRLVTSAGRAGLNAEGHIDGDIYLVLAATINASARPAPRSDGSPGAGRNLWLPMAEVRRNGIAL
jgi:hypothetical protein